MDVTYDYEQFMQSLEGLSSIDMNEDDDLSFQDDIDRAAYEAAIGMNPYTKPAEDNSAGLSLGMSEKFLKESTEGVVTDEEIKEYSSILYPKVKTLRSLILERFTPEQLLEFEKLTRNLEISNNKKVEIVIDNLEKWEIDHNPLNPGTNRLGLMIDGYVVKIALDSDGKIDNQREFMYSMVTRRRGTAKCYECSPNGICAVFQYGEVFTIDDYYKNQQRMREIIADIVGMGFLVGDVGVSSTNYLNWAYLDDGEIGIIDYAYIYSVKFNTFGCTSCRVMLKYDKDFVKLSCPSCGKTYSFKDIRKRISRKDQQKEIGDITEKGYVLSHCEEEVEFDPRFTEDAEHCIRKKLLKIQKKNDRKLKLSAKPQDINSDEGVMSFEDLMTNIKNRKNRRN